VLATVTGWTGDQSLQLTGPFHLGVAVGIATFELSGREDSTLLQFSFRAIGAIDFFRPLTSDAARMPSTG
jgi:hypothetical protein